MRASPHSRANGVAQSNAPPGERAVLRPDALDETAQDQALAERRQGRAGREGEIPPDLAARHDTEFERHAAEHQREQHHDHRQVERRHDDRIGHRKGHPQAAAAEHEPGLVAVPERRDRAHHLVALHLVAGEREQDADAEIEAVEDDVKRDRGADQGRPDHRQVPFHGAHRALSAASPDGSRAALKGRLGSAVRFRRNGAARDQPVDVVDAHREHDAVENTNSASVPAMLAPGTGESRRRCAECRARARAGVRFR